ncbi:MAG: Fic family protein, partial [Ignavibacteriae bacterium]|nr:Fic family protein [Ignavibacteriota bacterium]
VSSDSTWEEWILYMLEGIKQTSLETIVLISDIRVLMDRYKNEMKEKLPKIYSKDLLDNLFKHPYTKIEYLENDLNKHYMTARSYLEQLCEHGFLEKHSIGRNNYYLNLPLFELFTAHPTKPL